ncbi:hypothetical protein Taro_000120 [Colocasia esculenta]|uniref:Gnk2-homologous domain-containing protein n=1 Tax=Colocasia esculenta TaxID=4460 RepID=A0A843TGL5_COLES|nr:hypothetical protein [Colocasia esculenta]
MAATSYPALFALLLIVPLCHGANSIGQYCGSSYNSGQLKANINRVLNDLAARAPLDGFAVASYGSGTDAIYGLAQCRGDVSSQDCAACIADAVRELPNACPGQADARIWYDYCFARFDNENFVGQADTGYGVIYVNTESAENPAAFDKAAGKLMTSVRAKASVAGNRGLGRGKVQFSPYVTIYALADCTRDLSPLSCAQCLAAAVGKFPDYCEYRKGCQVNYSSCRARYEVYPFYFPLDSRKASLAAAKTEASYKVSYAKFILNP